MTTCNEIRARLTLYLDNELQGEERNVVATHLASCEGCGHALEDERHFLQAIRDARPPAVASAELKAKVVSRLEWPAVIGSSRRISVKWLAVAATLLILLLPVVVWRFTHRRPTPSTKQPSAFALMAAETHLRHTRGQLPLELESTNGEQISRWFSNKVNFSVQLPNYQESSGQEKLYTLQGARLVSLKDDYAAYVSYQMGEHPISLVITSDSVAVPSGGEEISAKGLTFHYNAIQGLKVITWSDRGLTYALVSDFEERGQQSCIVCHQGTKDRDFIEPLKPRS
jgi:anti-sigma factor RsiW